MVQFLLNHYDFTIDEELQTLIAQKKNIATIFEKKLLEEKLKKNNLKKKELLKI